MKTFRITFSDRTVWEVPAEVIACHRAHYYAQRDAERGEGDYESNFADEKRYALSQNYELKDWAANNMDWSDVKDEARRTDFGQSLPDHVAYQRQWVNAPVEIITGPDVPAAS